MTSIGIAFLEIVYTYDIYYHRLRLFNLASICNTRIISTIGVFIVKITITSLIERFITTVISAKKDLTKFQIQ